MNLLSKICSFDDTQVHRLRCCAVHHFPLPCTIRATFDPQYPMRFSCFTLGGERTFCGASSGERLLLRREQIRSIPGGKPKARRASEWKNRRAIFRPNRKRNERSSRSATCLNRTALENAARVHWRRVASLGSARLGSAIIIGKRACVPLKAHLANLSVWQAFLSFYIYPT